MLQTSLPLPQPMPVEGDRTAFQIGWDHAHHGLVPPPALLVPGHPIGQGWQAAQAVFGHRTLPARQAVRQWLALRLAAWQRGEGFDLEQLTPAHLQQLQVRVCPVRRSVLGGPEGHADAAVLVRLNEGAAWAAGHLAMLSSAAAVAMAGVDVHGARERAARAAALDDAVDGLDAAQWARAAALRAMATPMAFADAARVPLAALPPNRVRVLNAALGLQALLTRRFAGAGWAARAAEVARMLPEHTLRHDFNLFVGAMAPRVIEAQGGEAADVDRALGDAWLTERVQRRWQHFVFSLGEAGVESLLERVAALPQAGRRVLQHAWPQAVESWRLPAMARWAAAARPARPFPLRASRGAATA